MTVAYDRAGSKCLGVQPGTKALRDECLSLFDQSEDAGIYNCRQVRGGSSPSVHSEGRAWDAHFDQPGRGLRNPAGDELAWFLVDQHDLLSVQVVIWAKRMWSVTKPYWRTYGGQHDHLDHVHAEQNWHGAKKCTRATVRLAFQRWLGVVPQPEPPEDDDMPTDSGTIKPGDQDVILFPLAAGGWETTLRLGSHADGAKIRLVIGGADGERFNDELFIAKGGRRFEDRLQDGDEYVSIVNDGPQPVAWYWEAEK